jgi:hypothetical protein
MFRTVENVYLDPPLWRTAEVPRAGEAASSSSGIQKSEFNSNKFDLGQKWAKQ